MTSIRAVNGASEAGYTLVEMLVALLMIGLLLSALGAASQTFAKLQSRGVRQASVAERNLALANALDLLFRDAGPFSSSAGARLSGDRRHMSFVCDGGPCKVDLGPNVITPQGAPVGVVEIVSPLGRRRIASPELLGAEWTFIGSRTVSDHWPPDNPTDWQRLKAIALTRGPTNPSPAVLVKLWTEGEKASEAIGGAP